MSIPGTVHALAELLVAHRAADDLVGQLSREIDRIATGRDPSAVDLVDLDRASERERDLFMAICKFPAASKAERHGKAAYLLMQLETEEFEQEHVRSLLRSALRS